MELENPGRTYLFLILLNIDLDACDVAHVAGMIRVVRLNDALIDKKVIR